MTTAMCYRPEPGAAAGSRSVALTVLEATPGANPLAAITGPRDLSAVNLHAQRRLSFLEEERSGTH